VCVHREREREREREKREERREKREEREKRERRERERLTHTPSEYHTTPETLLPLQNHPTHNSLPSLLISYPSKNRLKKIGFSIVYRLQ
jgi:hypothetical protein